jgi:alkanesulfonate monooxygenase SsuD/methylene tetrahydromethanopterin reductase-like flavin-dependent oxidoreductase (luciferase family)
LRLVAQYADACNIFGDPDEVAHKLTVLRRHCDDVGRDPAEIEVTAMLRDLPSGASADDVVGAAESFAAVGVDALVLSALGPDPAGWLETNIGPVVDRVAAIEPTRG